MARPCRQSLSETVKTGSPFTLLTFVKKTGHRVSSKRNPQAKSQKQHPSATREICSQGREGLGEVRGAGGHSKDKGFPRQRGKQEGEGQGEGTRRRKDGARRQDGRGREGRRTAGEKMGEGIEGRGMGREDQRRGEGKGSRRKKGDGGGEGRRGKAGGGG